MRGGRLALSTVGALTMTNLSNASGSAVVTVGGEFTMTNLSNASGSMSITGGWSDVQHRREQRQRHADGDDDRT
jgi:hypothetical protein